MKQKRKSRNKSTHTYDQLIYDQKAKKQTTGKEQSLQLIETFDRNMKKNETRPLSYTIPQKTLNSVLNS